MTKYKLKNDLPTFKAGDIFEISKNGNLIKRGEYISDCIVAYSSQTLEKFPNIIKDWFEEIPEEPKTVWDLKRGNQFWFRATKGGLFDDAPVCPTPDYWDGSERQQSLRAIGGAFLTREECQRDIERSKARETLKRDAKEFKPDWSRENCEVRKWFVVWNILRGKLEADFANIFQENKIYFPTREDAEASIEAHEEEWKIYLGVEE